VSVSFFLFFPFSLCIFLLTLHHRLELEKYDSNDLIHGGIAFQRAKNIDSHQYDLRATVKREEGNEDEEDKYTFECKYTLSRVGYYCIFVQLGKYHIRGSPFFDLQAKPGATHAKSSVAYGPGLVVAHPHQVNTFTIEGRDRLGNTRTDPENPDGTSDEFIIGVIGPAIIEGGTIEMEMDDGYTTWKNGAIDNKNGTYTVNYRIDAQKALMDHSEQLEIYVKIDDGTMFNMESMSRYDTLGEDLQAEYEQTTYDDEEKFLYDSNGTSIGYSEEEIEKIREELDEMNQPNEPITRPIEASRVNIVSSPFTVGISVNTPRASSANRLRAHRPAATNDESQALTYKLPPSELDSKSNFETKSSLSPIKLSSSGLFSSTTSSPMTPYSRELELKEQQLKQWEESLMRKQQEISKLSQSNFQSSTSNNVNSFDGSSKASKTDDMVSTPVKAALLTPAANAAKKSIMSLECTSLFRKNRVALQALFNTYASDDHVSLEQFFSLCSDFDLFPTFLNKDGILACFRKY
jgi:hypothetical protein